MICSSIKLFGYIMNIYVFDIDKTLAKDQTIVLGESPEFADVYEWERIKRTMRSIIENGGEIWIVTTNYRSNPQDIKAKLFGTDMNDRLVEHVQVFDGTDIRITFGIAATDREQLTKINPEGRKPEFIIKRILAREDLRQIKVNCVLFDDLDPHIEKCSTAVSCFAPEREPPIQIIGYRVDDYEWQEEQTYDYPSKKYITPEIRPNRPFHTLSAELGFHLNILISTNEREKLLENGRVIEQEKSISLDESMLLGFK